MVFYEFSQNFIIIFVENFNVIFYNNIRSNIIIIFRYCSMGANQGGANMDLKEIKAFLTVAQLKNVSRAADILNYTQAAITIQIKRLEQELNTKLLNKVGKEMILTKNGEIFYSYATEILLNVSKAKESISPPKNSTEELILGTDSSLSISYLTPYFSHYRKNYPNTHIRIILDDAINLTDYLLQGDIHFACFLGNNLVKRKYIHSITAKIPLIIVASSQNKVLKKEKIASLKDLSDLTWVLPEKSLSVRSAIDDELTAQGISFSTFVDSMDMYCLVKLVEQSDAVSILPEFLVEDEILNGSLTALYLKDFNKSIRLQIAFSETQFQHHALQTFLKILKEHSQKKSYKKF